MSDNSRTAKEQSLDLSGATMLASGMLTWGRGERVSDRYGLVVLQTGGIEDFAVREGDERYLEQTDSEEYTDFLSALPLDGAHGELVVLGEGQLFRELAWDEGGVTAMGVGLQPTSETRCWGKLRGDEYRLWLDPRALYRVHEQTVHLFFLPTAPPAGPGPRSRLSPLGW